MSAQSSTDQRQFAPQQIRFGGQFQKRLASGAYGVVGYFVDIQSGQKFAVKKMKNLPHNWDEIEVNKLLPDSPNIVKFTEIDSDEQFIYAKMPLADCDVSDLVASYKGRRMSLDRFWRFFFHILNALCLLQEAKIVHYDLKASNILVFGQVFALADFGFSFHQSNPSLHHTTNRTAPPEINRGQRSKEQKLYRTSKIDMWAFGCVCFQILSAGISLMSRQFSSQEKISHLSKVAPQQYFKQILSGGMGVILGTMLRQSPFERPLPSQLWKTMVQNKMCIPQQLYLPLAEVREINKKKQQQTSKATKSRKKSKADKRQRCPCCGKKVSKIVAHLWAIHPQRTPKYFYLPVDLKFRSQVESLVAKNVPVPVECLSVSMNFSPQEIEGRTPLSPKAIPASRRALKTKPIQKKSKHGRKQ